MSAWSSGTGAAGAVGALSYLGLTALLSPSNTCLVMTIVPLMMAASFIYLLSRRPDKGSATTQVVMSDPYTFKQKVSGSGPRARVSLPNTFFHLALCSWCCCTGHVDQASDCPVYGTHVHCVLERVLD